MRRARVRSFEATVLTALCAVLVAGTVWAANEGSVTGSSMARDESLPHQGTPPFPTLPPTPPLPTLPPDVPTPSFYTPTPTPSPTPTISPTSTRTLTPTVTPSPAGLFLPRVLWGESGPEPNADPR